ncbi:hypothetical protein J6590_094092 [Homalodisca vitripennis]|nr:hypothetical protein J6590_094092 [Homalodisca vitripennis]
MPSVPLLSALIKESNPFREVFLILAVLRLKSSWSWRGVGVGGTSGAAGLTSVFQTLKSLAQTQGADECAPPEGRRNSRQLNATPPLRKAAYSPPGKSANHPVAPWLGALLGRVSPCHHWVAARGASHHFPESP